MGTNRMEWRVLIWKINFIKEFRESNKEEINRYLSKKDQKN